MSDFDDYLRDVRKSFSEEDFSASVEQVYRFIRLRIAISLPDAVMIVTINIIEVIFKDAQYTLPWYFPKMTKIGQNKKQKLKHWLYSHKATNLLLDLFKGPNFENQPKSLSMLRIHSGQTNDDDDEDSSDFEIDIISMPESYCTINETRMDEDELLGLLEPDDELC